MSPVSVDPRPSVLVASGSPLFGRALVRALGDGMCVVTTADQSEVVRAELASGTVAVCLLHDALHDGSGLELCAALSSDPATQGVPIVIFSRDPASEAAALEHGAAGFLRAPCSGPEARDAVSEILTPADPVAAASALDPLPDPEPVQGTAAPTSTEV